VTPRASQSAARASVDHRGRSVPAGLVDPHPFDSIGHAHSHGRDVRLDALTECSVRDGSLPTGDDRDAVVGLAGRLNE
jgi:hypothetical protein